MTDVLVAMHGYDPAGVDGGKPFDTVIEDRFERTYRVADTLQDWGLDVDVIVSCDPDSGGADSPAYGHMTEQYPDKTAELDIHFEDISANTTENVQEFYRIAREQDVEGIISVSSPDHAPRVLREWHTATDADIPLIAATGSRETYAASDHPPFIVEGAAFVPFVEAFNEIWDVDPEQYEEAAEEVTDVLQKYHPD